MSKQRANSILAVAKRWNEAMDAIDATFKSSREFDRRRSRASIDALRACGCRPLWGWKDVDGYPLTRRSGGRRAYEAALTLFCRARVALEA